LWAKLWITNERWAPSSNKILAGTQWSLAAMLVDLCLKPTSVSGSGLVNVLDPGCQFFG